MPPNPDENYLSAEVLRLAAETFRADPAGVTLASRFEEDLGGDSLFFVELIMTVEQRFDVLLSDAYAGKIRTVGELVELIEQTRTSRPLAKKENSSN